MRNCLLFALATAIGSAMQLAPSVAQQPARATFDELKQGGFVIVIRHGRTNESPAFPRDESPTNLADCSGQTMLTEVGQDQARVIGAAFRNAGIPVGKVLGDDGFQVQMRMRINDAGQQQHAGGIDLARSWRGHKLWTDLHDFLAADSGIGLHAAVFVDDKTVMNDQLPGLLRLRRAGLHHQGHRQAGYDRQAGSYGGGRSAARPRS